MLRNEFLQRQQTVLALDVFHARFASHSLREVLAAAQVSSPPPPEQEEAAAEFRRESDSPNAYNSQRAG